MQYHYYHFSVHICAKYENRDSVNFLRISKDEQDYAEKFNLPPATTSRRTVQAVKLNLAKALIRFDMEAYFPNEYEPFQSTCKSKPLKKKRILNFLSKYFPFLEYYVFSQKENVPLLEKWYVIKIHFRFKPFLYMYYSQTFAPYKNFRHLGCSVQ